MKKTKILVALTTVAVSAVAALGLTACKKQTDNKNAEIYAIYTEYVAYAESNGEKPLSYEEWLSTIKGEKGDKGEKGEKGENGKDGHTPIITIGENGNWFIDGVDTTVKAQGEQGEKGENGNDGEQGERGVGIEKVEYDKDGNLIIYFTDGTQQNVKAPEKHEHTFGEWTAFTAEDTFCENRLFYRECTECNSVEWKRGSYSDHKWSVVTTVPTCQSRGYDTKTCDICGKVEIVNYTDIVDHAWKSEYSYDNSYHWLGCATCDEIKGKEEHTVESSGECSVCHALVGATEGVLYDITNGKASVIGYEGTATRVRIADTYNGAPVTEIYDSAFKNKNIVSVVIPEGVTIIGKAAFADCSSLTNIELPNSLITIGESAFCNCSRLTSIELPKSLTAIGGYSFYNCRQLMSIKIPNGVTTIKWAAFYNCSSLTSVEIPSSVTVIQGEAFKGCVSLKSVEIPNGVTDIYPSVFEDCSGLMSVEIPNSVKSIWDRAFNGCISLRSVEIPDNVMVIEEYAFSGCNKLQFKEYGNAKYLGNKDNEYFALIEATNKNYSTYTIHENAKVIAALAFEACTRMTEIVIPETIISICNYAFYGCESLNKIVISSSIATIGESAFYRCSSLEKVYYTGTKLDWTNVKIGGENNYLTAASRYYYSETQPTDTGDKYWHFVDGEIVEW